MISQAVILCGGMGTRLGELTRATPKPLLNVGGRPFLDFLLFELGRHGFQNVLFLAGFGADQIRDYANENPLAKRFGLSLDVLVEPEPAGTAGALLLAEARLEERFLLMNGDSIFDINLCALASDFENDRDALMRMALREVADASRFGAIERTGDRVASFRQRPIAGAGQAGLINAGVYAASRSLLEHLPGAFSLEGEVLPGLANRGLVTCKPYHGYFVDIGVPESYAAAQTATPAHFVRPALFLDRDGVINRDHGYVGQVERFEWIPGAKKAVRMANDSGWFVFIVTNQAGVARGFYTEDDVAAIHDKLQAELREEGAHIDDIKYCPCHPEGSVGKYARESGRRKPAPGMILELLAEWPVDRHRSLLIGDKESDVAAARAADVAGRLFAAVRLDEFVGPSLEDATD